MKLVLDSNIFIADFWLRGTQFALLKDALQRIDGELLVSEVVIAEVKASTARDSLKRCGPRRRRPSTLRISWVPERCPVSPMTSNRAATPTGSTWRVS